MRETVLDGKRISYSDDTVFRIQVGKGRKGSYGQTKYNIKGNLAQAVALYNGINIGNGYKKRLLMIPSNKPVLARATS